MHDEMCLFNSQSLFLDYKHFHIKLQLLFQTLPTKKKKKPQILTDIVSRSALTAMTKVFIDNIIRRRTRNMCPPYVSLSNIISVRF